MKKLYTLLASVVISASINAQVNLIPNDGFENWTDGTPDSWFVTGSTVAQSTTIFHGGTSSLGFTAPATGNKTISPTTDIPVTQGVTYVFSGWYLDNDTTARFRFWNQFRTASADTGTNPLQGADYSTDSPSWQFFTAEATPHVNAVVARAGLRIYPEASTTGGGVIYFDDIKFYDKSTLSLEDVKNFDNQVKMATVVSDILTIQMPTRATVNIYSMDGKLFSSNRVDSEEAINTQSLSAGVYIVTIQNDYAKTSRKIVKK
ncbi:T9SS type A sorting domain-containing protein [Flavobacterium solisilvae]|uniref:T9SS type A sorting domain-containing protein n=1 Tax=Flavobacterium solisilvae TaxID=1852019 RepID=A0ABX1QTG7_9FLAO|nr:T9SS type A sorting domain-containing protein [Flavobacterium solisilvae]NMH25003.1 T9SS type A sorting domain-containing protein [Flavobacterium solisilvae]